MLNIQNSLATVPRLNLTPQVSISPVITSGSAYTSGFQVGPIMHLQNVVRQNGNVFQDGGVGFGQAELHSVKILDASGQNAPIDVWFFAASPTLTNAGDHTAYSITGANAKAAGVQGAISVGVSYSASGAAGVSSDGGNLSLNCYVPTSSTTPNDLYAVAIVRGTPTYTSTTALTFIYNFYAD